MQLKQAISDSAFTYVANKLEGRRVLRLILEEAGISRASFSNDPLITAYNEGKRAVGLWILDQYFKKPELLQLIESDKHNDRTSDIND